MEHAYSSTEPNQSRQLHERTAEPTGSMPVDDRPDATDGGLQDGVVTQGVESIFPAWLMDPITDFMMLHLPGPAGRAAIICELIDEMRGAADWFADSRPDGGLESQSLSTVQQHAREHLIRMTAAAEPLPESTIGN